MSYEELTSQFYLDCKQNFWKYSQIRDCIKSRLNSGTENYILDFLNMPQERYTASQFYKWTVSFMSGEFSNVKLLWQRDLKTNFTQEKWLDILADCGKYINEAIGKFTQYKIIHRCYYTPTRLYRMITDES